MFIQENAQRAGIRSTTYLPAFPGFFLIPLLDYSKHRDHIFIQPRLRHLWKHVLLVVHAGRISFRSVYVYFKTPNANAYAVVPDDYVVGLCDKDARHGSD